MLYMKIQNDKMAKMQEKMAVMALQRELRKVEEETKGQKEPDRKKRVSWETGGTEMTEEEI